MRISSGLLIAALLAAPSGAAFAQASKERAPEPKRPGADAPVKDANAVAKETPLNFYVAKSEPGICGDGCDEWIVAEGTFDSGSAQRFGKFLALLGNRKLPVFFHSPGGSVPDALAIGRMLRAHGLTAAVGRTLPEGCEPLKERDESCRALKTSGRVLPADLRTNRTMCNSACVYALAGGAQRQVPAGAQLGVHSAKIILLFSDGHKVFSAPEPVLRARLRRLNEQVGRYLDQMGIDNALLQAANVISPDHIRYLSRDEIVRYRIDTRDFQESRWMVDEGPPGPFAVNKYLVEAKGNDHDQYRTTRVRLTCLDDTFLRVDLVRELAADDGGVKIPLQMTSQNLGVTFQVRLKQPMPGSDNAPLDMRVERVPIDTVRSAVSADAIALSEIPQRAQVDRPPHVTKFATTGLAASFTALQRHCH